MRGLLTAGLVLLAVPALAGPFAANGYTGSASVTQTGPALALEGRINSGDPCRRLVVSAVAVNNSGKRLLLESVPIAYGGGLSLLFASPDREVPPFRVGWRLAEVEVRCLDPGR